MSARPTLNEIVETLKRSSLPTVVIEGDDDFSALMPFEEENADSAISILPVHGKHSVIDLFYRRSEFSNIRTAFLLDQDLWIFSGIPPEFSAAPAVTTWGYSIENDLCFDGDVTKYLTVSERTAFDDEIGKFSRIWAHEACEVFAGNAGLTGMSASSAFENSCVVRPCYIGRVDTPTPPALALDDVIRADYLRYVRGKALLGLLTRQLSRPGRKSKFSKANILEMGTVARGPKLQRLEGELKAVLGI